MGAYPVHLLDRFGPVLPHLVPALPRFGPVLALLGLVLVHLGLVLAHPCSWRAVTLGGDLVFLAIPKMGTTTVMFFCIFRRRLFSRRVRRRLLHRSATTWRHRKRLPVSLFATLART